jgi:hypothetical protein
MSAWQLLHREVEGLEPIIFTVCTGTTTAGVVTYVTLVAPTGGAVITVVGAFTTVGGAYGGGCEY